MNKDKQIEELTKEVQTLKKQYKELKERVEKQFGVTIINNNIFTPIPTSKKSS